MNIKRLPDRSIEVNLNSFINRLLQEYGLEKCNPDKSPSNTSIKLSKTMSPTNDEEILEMKNKPYNNLTGSLLYLASHTRPDIAHLAGTLARHTANPGKQHWEAAKRCLRYLRNNPKPSLRYFNEPTKLGGYADADWAGDTDTRKSTTGFMFSLNENSSPISWRSKRQPTVAQSTAEAEYVAATEAANEAIWLRRLLKDLGEPQQGPTIILEDNQSCIAMSENPVFHYRTKHIDIRYHVIRDYVEKELVLLVHIPTKQQLADILTKSLHAPRFIYLRDQILSFSNV